MKRQAEQRGSTLLVGLVMLVLMMLIAVSTINRASTDLQIVGNAQFKVESTAAGQMAIENVISESAFKTVAPVEQNIDINNDGVADYHVQFDPPPSCVSYRVISVSDADVPEVCFGSIGPLCYWTIWDVTATVTDLHGSGASVTIHQGIRTIAGLNAALTACGV